MSKILDAQGRDVDVVWKAKALASWLHEPKIARSLPPIHMIALSYYLKGERIEATEPVVEDDVKLALSGRVTRRLIASHLVKEKGLDRGEAMEALRKMGGAG